MNLIQKTKMFGAVLSTLLLATSCGGSGSNPTPAKKMVGSFSQAKSCEEVTSFVNTYAARAKKSSTVLVPVQMTRSSDESASNGSFAASPMQEGAGAPADASANPDTNAPEVIQSDIAFADEGRSLLYVGKRGTGFDGVLKVYSVSSSNALLSSVDLGFEPSEFLAVSNGPKKHLIVFGNYYNWGSVPGCVESNPEMMDACSDLTTYSMVALFDVENPAHPVEIKREKMRGSFMEARAISESNSIVWVSQNYLPLTEGGAISEDDILVQKSTSENGGTSTTPVSSCDQILLYQNDTLDPKYAPSSLTQTFISVLKLGEENSIHSQTVISSAWSSFAAVNPAHLFLVQNVWEDDTSEIYEFDLNSASGSPLEFLASGTVNGSIKNQFFLDEKDGVLRVFYHRSSFAWLSPACASCAMATPSAAVAENEQAATLTDDFGNFLSTFERSGDKLIGLGGVGPFEENEVPYSARFMGNVGCVITYLQIDPLTCFDLRDPAHPIMTGSLELAGVSYHLEPIAEDLLLGIGIDGSFQTVANLFNLTDLAHPTLDQQLTLGSSSGWTEAFSDYRALGVDENHTRFALPINLYTSWEVAIFSLDPATHQMSSLGKIQKSFSSQNSSPDPSNTQPLDAMFLYPEVKRAFFFEDQLALVTSEGVEVYRLSDLSSVYNDLF